MAEAPSISGRIVDELRPLPVPNDLTRPFYEATSEGRLDIQRCQRCRTYFYPPLPFCDICDGRDLRFETVSGRGTIYTFTRVHANRMPLDHQPMAGGLAFEPELVARAAEEGGVAGFVGLAEGFVVLEADHEDAAGFIVLDNGRDEAVELGEVEIHVSIPIKKPAGFVGGLVFTSKFDQKAADRQIR